MIVRHVYLKSGFSLIEVVMAVGIASFSILITVGLLAVANDTNKSARDEAFAAQLVANEFQRIRALDAAKFPSKEYKPRYYSSDLKDLGQGVTPDAAYELAISIVDEPGRPGCKLLNATVSYPVQAAPANRESRQYTTLVIEPVPTPTPTPTPAP